MWAKLRFSLVHLAPTKEESVQEFYQMWHESFFQVWKELTLVSDPQSKDLYKVLLVYCLYTSFRTCKLDSKPRIEIDKKHYDIIYAQASEECQTELFQSLPYCVKMLKYLAENGAFVCSFGLGCKTIQMTKSLNVRANPRPFEFKEVSRDIQTAFNLKQAQDKD